MENHRNRGPCFFFFTGFFLQLVFAHSLCLSCYMGGSISFVVGSLQGWEDREWLWLHANRCLTCTIPVILKPSASRCKIVKCKRSLEQLQAQVIQTSTYLWVWCHIEGRHALMPWTTSNLVRHPWFRWTLLRPMKGKQASGMQIFHLRFARRITLPETNGAIAPEHGWDWKTILSFWDVATLAELLVSGSVLVLTTCIWQGFTGIFPSCQFLIGVTGFWEATFMVHESGLGWRKAGTNTPPTLGDYWSIFVQPRILWGQIFARQGAFPSTIIEWRRLEDFCWHLRSLVISCERKHFFDCFSAKDTGGRKMQQFACWGMDQAEKKSWEMYKSLNNWYNIESKAQQFASTMQTCNELLLICSWTKFRSWILILPCSGPSWGYLFLPLLVEMLQRLPVKLPQLLLSVILWSWCIWMMIAVALRWWRWIWPIIGPWNVAIAGTVANWNKMLHGHIVWQVMELLL